MGLEKLAVVVPCLFQRGPGFQLRKILEIGIAQAVGKLELEEVDCLLWKAGFLLLQPRKELKDAVGFPFECGKGFGLVTPARRSEEHTSELQSLMRISYAVFCLTKKT